MIWIILKILGAILGGYIVSYIITMASFWIDLNINQPKEKEVVSYMKGKHLMMHKWVWLACILVILYYFFVK